MATKIEGKNRGKTKILALYGQQFSGKSTLAKYLAGKFNGEEGRKAVVFSFADPLYEMLSVLEPSLRRGKGEEKPSCDKNEKRLLLCHQTIRYGLQTLGTEWARNCMGDDIWARNLLMRISEEEEKVKQGDELLIVVDDLRFDNERTFLKLKNSYFCCLCLNSGLQDMGNCERSESHASEVDWMKWIVPSGCNNGDDRKDLVLTNDFTEEFLERSSDFFLRKVFK